MGALVGILSPTRAAARWLIDNNWIKDFRTMLRWNLLFYFVALCLYVIINIDPALLQIHGSMSLGVFVYLCLVCVNELVFAFYGDSIPDKIGNTRKSLPINKRERVILINLAYLEVIIWFWPIYYAIDAFYASDKPFMSSFQSLADAVFLSGVTLTSLGSNEFYAVKPLSRYVTLYEAMIGIVFIALGLAAYIGTKDRSQAAALPPSSPQASPSPPSAPVP